MFVKFELKLFKSSTLNFLGVNALYGILVEAGADENVVDIVSTTKIYFG